MFEAGEFGAEFGEALEDLAGVAVASDGAEELSVWASQNLQCAKLFVTQFHPFMGAHTGPGLVGASWWAE